MKNGENLFCGIIIGIIISIIYNDKTIENLWCDYKKNTMCAKNQCNTSEHSENFIEGNGIGEPLLPYYEMNRKILHDSCENCSKPILINNTKYAGVIDNFSNNDGYSLI